MISLTRRLAAVATAALLGGPLLAFAPTHAADGDVTLNLIGINDFHGRIDNNTVKFAGTVEQLRAEAADANSLVISAGDNVSASLFASSVQGDIPTIDVLNALDLSASAAGNHEFDKGADDLTGRLSDAADFPFLAANVFKSGGAPLLKKYEIFNIDGVDVAVIGALTEETPSLVSPAGIAGLTFTDPTDAINDTVAELEGLADVPDVMVVSIHEGAPDGNKTYAQNVAESTVFKKIMEQTDPAVDAIFMGHTHQKYAYDAPVTGGDRPTRPVIQTGNYGSNVGQIKLTFNKNSGTVTGSSLKNTARTAVADGTLTATYPRVADVKPIVDDALAFADAKGSEPVANQSADISRAFSAPGVEDRGAESTVGDLVGNALLDRVKDLPAGADIGVVNPGGLRADLRFAGTGGSNGDGVITFAEANSVLPFFNNISSVTLTGAQFKKVLEQQWQRLENGQVPSRPYLQLGLSDNVNYSFDPSRTEGDRITSVTINGGPLNSTATYKVATFSFLAAGGDNFRAFAEGTSVDTGLVDYEEWISYLRDNSPVSPSFARRAVQVDGIKDSYNAGESVTFSLPKLDLTSLNSQANTSVSATLFYGNGMSKSLGTAAVTGGASDPFTFTPPAGVSGAMRIETTAAPTGTKASIPLFVEKAESALTVKKVTPRKIVVNRTKPLIQFSVTSNGAKLDGGTVTITYGGRTTTGMVKDGKAKVRMGPFTSSGTDKQVTATYSGNEETKPSTVSFTVRVERK